VNTHAGLVRTYNEDRVTIVVNMAKPKDKFLFNWPNISYFAIYDGHGGSSCADFLKEKLHWIIIN
jgi:protein phosphatase 2C family protein 2/3